MGIVWRGPGVRFQECSPYRVIQGVSVPLWIVWLLSTVKAVTGVKCFLPGKFLRDLVPKVSPGG